MLETPITHAGNMLLAKLAKADAELLQPLLEHIDLKVGEELYQVGQPLDYAYFPLPAFAPLLPRMQKK